MDADRIDYIRRDCELSGFIRSSVDYDRFFRNFIVQEPGSRILKSTGDNKYVAPSEKAKSDFEKILWERYQEYMYIVGHHRVCMFDEITKRLLYFAMRLGSLDETLKGIQALRKHLEPPQRPRTDSEFDQLKAISCFLKYDCDDGVVDEIFKQIMRIESHPESELLTAYERELLVNLATVLCEKRDYFTSAFKTDAAFWDWMAGITNHGARKWSQHPVLIAELVKRVRERGREIERDVFSDPKTEGTIILIGDAYQKIKTGLGDAKTIETYKLVGLNSFLEAKHDEIRAFNVWYALGPNVEREALLEAIADKLGLRDGLLPNSYPQQGFSSTKI